MFHWSDLDMTDQYAAKMKTVLWIMGTKSWKSWLLSQTSSKQHNGLLWLVPWALLGHLVVVESLASGGILVLLPVWRQPSLHLLEWKETAAVMVRYLLDLLVHTYILYIYIYINVYYIIHSINILQQSLRPTLHQFTWAWGRNRFGGKCHGHQAKLTNHAKYEYIENKYQNISIRISQPTECALRIL